MKAEVSDSLHILID